MIRAAAAMPQADPVGRYVSYVAPWPGILITDLQVDVTASLLGSQLPNCTKDVKLIVGCVILKHLTAHRISPDNCMSAQLSAAALGEETTLPGLEKTAAGCLFHGKFIGVEPSATGTPEDDRYALWRRGIHNGS